MWMDFHGFFAIEHHVSQQPVHYAMPLPLFIFLYNNMPSITSETMHITKVYCCTVVPSDRGLHLILSLLEIS